MTRVRYDDLRSFTFGASFFWETFMKPTRETRTESFDSVREGANNGEVRHCCFQPALSRTLQESPSG